MTEFRDEEMKGARFEDVDLEGARFRSVNLSGARIIDALLADAKLSGDISGLVINDIEVAPLIAAEMERRYPERKELFATDPEGMRRGWQIVDEQWAATIERAEALPEPALHERVDEEWSFLETLRHMIMVFDSWVGRTILGAADHFHPYGVPPSFLDPEVIGADVSADPSFEEVLPVWRERMDVVRDVVDQLTPEELDRTCDPNPARGYPPSAEHKVFACLWTVIEEAWQHNRFANRDLDTLTS